VLGQNPTGSVIYLSIAFAFMLPRWDAEIAEVSSVKPKPKWYEIQE